MSESPASSSGQLTPHHPLWTGSDPRLFESALELRRELGWLVQVFPDPDTAEYYFWLVNFGLRERPERLLEFLPAFPPNERMREISGTDDREAFLNVGTQAAHALLELLDGVGADAYAPRRVLDFGCGCARVIRHLQPLASRWELSGCDIDSDAIEYCRRAIPRANFFANLVEPPLPTPDGAFDFIYSISVFTHLPPEPSRRWVSELGRTLGPKGLAAISVHGELGWQRVVTEPDLQLEFGLTRSAVAKAIDDWNRDGLVFLSHVVPKAWDHAEPYGLVFVRRDRLEELWTGYELLRYRPGVLSDWQDLALFRAT